MGGRDSPVDLAILGAGEGLQMVCPVDGHLRGRLVRRQVGHGGLVLDGRQRRQGVGLGRREGALRLRSGHGILVVLARVHGRRGGRCGAVGGVGECGRGGQTGWRAGTRAGREGRAAGSRVETRDRRRGREVEKLGEEARQANSRIVFVPTLRRCSTEDAPVVLSSPRVARQPGPALVRATAASTMGEGRGARGEGTRWWAAGACSGQSRQWRGRGRGGGAVRGGQAGGCQRWAVGCGLWAVTVAVGNGRGPALTARASSTSRLDRQDDDDGRCASRGVRRPAALALKHGPSLCQSDSTDRPSRYKVRSTHIHDVHRLPRYMVALSPFPSIYAVLLKHFYRARCCPLSVARHTTTTQSHPNRVPCTIAPVDAAIRSASFISVSLHVPA